MNLKSYRSRYYGTRHCEQRPSVDPMNHQLREMMQQLGWL